MNIESFLNKLKSTPEDIDFNALIALIDANYIFSPTAFKNGDLHNAQNENNGSCKLFYFAQLQGLNKDETLACFGTYYRDDVLKNPDSDTHQNIRNFMRYGWQGIDFEAEALVQK